MVYATDFIYNGKSLSEFSSDYIVAGFNADADGDIVSRSVNRSDITYDQPLTHDYGAVDSNIYSFEMTIIKRSGEIFTSTEARSLIGWLISPVVPKWLHLIGCTGDDFRDIDYQGRFVNARYEGSVSQKIGITLTFENTSPYGYSVEHTYVATPNSTITINNSGTSVGKVILPHITIAPNATGVVTINNLSDDLDAFSINVTSSQTVIIENHYCHLTNGNIYPFTNLNNYNWVTIKDGENRIAVSGNATVTFKMRFFEAIGT